MCGIVGLLRRAPVSVGDTDRARVAAMAACLAHRGPDHRAVWDDPAVGVTFGHLRLAIVDLSPAGEQPMASAGGRFTIVFNGEIYNHLDLRHELEGAGLAPPWRGHSDTETLLAGFEGWGVAATLRRTIGMFAFALWDRTERVLLLGRDRLGEKPLYYGWQGTGADRTLIFASEMAAIERHPAADLTIDRQALTAYMRTGYVPAPHSIYRGIAKLMPGTIGIVRADRDDVLIEPYWRATDAIAAGRADPFAGSPGEAVDALETLLTDAVGRQMMADVPLGAFLSGGIDSSTVVALMQKASARRVQTFSIGFHEKGFDEAVHAKAVAAHLGTQHTELYVTPREALDVIPQLPSIYSEPFADSSQIPTYLVSKLARSAVTVALSGDAGDELFAGYSRYQLTQRLWDRLARLPRPLRATAAKLLVTLSPQAWQRIGDAVGRVAPPIRAVNDFGGKVHKGAAVLASRDADELYRGMTSYWMDPAAVVLGGTLPTDEFDLPPGLSHVERMMAIDLVTYLPDDILTKVDRAGMAVSLEGRVPFLDHRVVEFAWRLPLAVKLRDGISKWPLREVLYRHVPRALIDRPKMGFGVPVGAWLRGPLRDWAEDLLEERSLTDGGYFEPEPIRAALRQHLAGHVDKQALLWPVLMFQAWLSARDRAAIR